MSNLVVNLGNGERIPLEDLLVEEYELLEAATNKKAAQRLMRSLAGLLEDKKLPRPLRTAVESLRAALKKSWNDLADEAEETAKEGYGMDWDEPVRGIPGGATSFADLVVAQQAHEFAEKIEERTRQFTGLVENVMYSSIEDKVATLRTLVEEFIVVLGLEDSVGTDSELSDSAEQMTESLAESAGQIMELVEVEGEAANAPLLLMDVQIIEPGWGNKNDNHYYSREMLRRDARAFEGVKMYATDHVEREKSVRTEVSQIIECPVRFTESGAPVARVAIYDPDFDFSVRQRSKAGKLGDLQCSILADGQVKEGFELGGRKGKSVERIIEAKSVDWVTRAGAGGKALALVESEQGADDMTEQLTEEEVAVEEAEVSLEEEAVTTEEIRETEETPVLSAQAIVVSLVESGLPAAVQTRLAANEYETAEALAEAI